MHINNRLSVRQMQAGQSASVVQIQGGFGLVHRLEALGIVPGRKLTKVSSMLLRGPVTIAINGSQVAIGFGMAGKIIVEPELS